MTVRQYLLLLITAYFMDPGGSFESFFLPTPFKLLLEVSSSNVGENILHSLKERRVQFPTAQSSAHV